MKASRLVTATLLILLAALSLSPFLGIPTKSVAHGSASNAVLQVWSPDLHSSNITSLDPAFQPGSQFTVRVNVTSPTPLLGFDVSLNYNITEGQNVLQALCYPSSSTCANPAPTDPLAGGLFDPNSPPTACGIIVAKAQIDVPAGFIRYAAVVQGGCTVPGTGTLFSITFKVVGTGATSIDIVQVGYGKPSTAIIGGIGNPPFTVNLPYTPYSAYFRNKAGIPPIPTFTFSPSHPISGDTVTFDARQTIDPDNANAPDHGIQTEPIVYDTNNNQVYDAGEPVIFGTAPALGTPLGAPPPSACRFVCPPHNRPDPHFTYVNSTSSGHWVPGDSVVYDANLNGIFDAGDWVISGPLVSLGTKLSQDPLITYVDIHQNNVWDNGYVWEWGDGSSQISTGNVTDHIFQSVTTVPASGNFTVKLVVFDSDNGLPNRQIQVANVGPLRIYDIAAFLSLSAPVVNEGQPLGIAVTVTNVGNQLIEDSNITITYDLNGGTKLVSVAGVSLGVQASKTLNYTLDTSSLFPRVYTMTVQAFIINATSHQIIPNANPDNIRSVSFTVLRPLLAHDVGVLNVYPEITTAQSGQPVPIEVIVANFGTNAENVTIATFYDSYMIANTSVILPANPSNPPQQGVYTIWNTTGVPPGTYIISATAILPTDQNPRDNTFVDGTVTILPPPTITLSATSGTVGSQIIAHGTMFPSGSLLEMNFDDQLLGFAFPNEGNFTFTFNVPIADPTRPHRLAASEFGPYGQLASVAFQVLPPPGAAAQLNVGVQVGDVYFPGDTAVIYVQTSLNGAAVATDSVQVSLAMPNGAISILQATRIQPGLFKATFLIPTTATSGTYVVWATASKTGSTEGSSLGVFEVKPSWVRGQGAMITGGVTSIALVGVVVLAWQKGYLRKKPED